MSTAMMRTLAHHVHLLITTMSEARQPILVATAKSSLEFLAAEVGKNARYICRTICGMITWAAVLLLRVGEGRFEDVANPYSWIEKKAWPSFAMWPSPWRHAVMAAST